MANQERLLLRIVVPLAIAETLIWAITFYMFPAMFPTWEQELGWSKQTLSGALTIALVLSAMMAPLAGRLIDRSHGRTVMVSSVMLAGVMLWWLSGATTSWQFYLAWIGLGIAMGGALYEACFAFVTHLCGVAAKRAIIAITLVAGFAGTVSFPLTHGLNEAFGWRSTLLLYAALSCLVIAPLILSVPARPGGSSQLKKPGISGVAVALYNPVFWYLSVGYALIALEHGIIITHLLPILSTRGLSTTSAVAAASLIGPMQVVGRVTMIGLQRRFSILTISLISVITLGVAAISLYLAAWFGMLALVFVVLQGAGNGVTSISRPVLTAEYLGFSNFGAISGAIACLFMLMMAVAPSIASLLWLKGGYDLVLGFVLSCCVVSLVCLRMVSKYQPERGE